MGLQDIQQRIDATRVRHGREDDDITLIAVSKVQPPDRVLAVLEAGHRVFGENRVQEAQNRWPDFQDRFDGIVLHLVGPLQTNKVKQALDMFDAIHTVDRDKLARRIADQVQDRGSCPELFVQVNTGAEPQKSGILPEDADAFVATCRAMDLPIAGLMCLPPVDEEPSLHFALLARIAHRNGLSGLSMGMSGDFERAIAMGATHVRVGSAIFGERDPTLLKA